MMKLYSAQPAQPHMVALLDKYGCFLESGGGRKKEKESGICGLAPRPAWILKDSLRLYCLVQWPSRPLLQTPLIAAG